MTDPSNPTYQIRRDMPTPEVPPDHPFEPIDRTFCGHVVVVLQDGHEVLCGLRPGQHSIKHTFPPDEARDL